MLWALWAYIMHVMVQPLDLLPGRLHGLRPWHWLHSPAATVTAVAATNAARATPWPRWLQVHLRALHCCTANMLLPERRLLQESWSQVRHVQTKGGFLPRHGELALPWLARIATAATAATTGLDFSIATAVTSCPGCGLCRARRALPRGEVLRGGDAAMLQAQGQAVCNVQEPPCRKDRLRHRWMGLSRAVDPVAFTAFTAEPSRAPTASVSVAATVTIGATHGTYHLRQGV